MYSGVGARVSGVPFEEPSADDVVRCPEGGEIFLSWASSGHLCFPLREVVLQQQIRSIGPIVLANAKSTCLC